MTQDFVEVTRFADPIEATLAKNQLEAAGIKAFLMDDTTVTMDWLLSNAIGGVKVVVAPQDLERAELILFGEEKADPKDLAAAAEAAEPEEEVEEADEESPEASEEGDETTATPREVDAERAYKAAVFGLLLYPLQFYACWLLLAVYFSDERLEGTARRRAWVAAVINGCVFVLPVLVLFWLKISSR
jgi:hypothetical protein